MTETETDTLVLNQLQLVFFTISPTQKKLFEVQPSNWGCVRRLTISPVIYLLVPVLEMQGVRKRTLQRAWSLKKVSAVKRQLELTTLAPAERTWWGELWSISKASVLLLIGMGQLLEAAVSNIWSQWRAFSWVCSDGCAFLESLKDPVTTGLQSSTIVLPLRSERHSLTRSYASTSLSQCTCIMCRLLLLLTNIA